MKAAAEETARAAGAAVEVRMVPLPFALGEARLAVRVCGCCVAGLAELARAEAGGCLGPAEPSWGNM